MLKKLLLNPNERIQGRILIIIEKFCIRQYIFFILVQILNHDHHSFAQFGQVGSKVMGEKPQKVNAKLKSINYSLELISNSDWPQLNS
jgi:hypothetical protein